MDELTFFEREFLDSCTCQDEVDEYGLDIDLWDYWDGMYGNNDEYMNERYKRVW